MGIKQGEIGDSQNNAFLWLPSIDQIDRVRQEEVVQSWLGHMNFCILDVIEWGIRVQEHNTQESKLCPDYMNPESVEWLYPDIEVYLQSIDVLKLWDRLIKWEITDIRHDQSTSMISFKINNKMYGFHKNDYDNIIIEPNQ